MSVSIFFMENKVIVMVVALWAVLTVGLLTTIYPQQANASKTCNTGPVCGGNGGLGGNGVNGGMCTTSHCNASGGGGNGENGGDANGGQGTNGLPGTGAIPCVDGHRTLTSSDGRTLTQAC
jgi:hypothetical protein